MLAMRPTDAEYAPFYASYVAQVPDGRLMEELRAQPETLRTLVADIDDARASLPSAPGKWSLKETLNHMSDAERVFALRLLWFARAPGASLPSFDQDAWAPLADAGRRSVRDLGDEFAAVRAATLALVESLPEEAASRQGVASGHPVTVRALAWIIAAHAGHHLARLREGGLGGQA